MKNSRKSNQFLLVLQQRLFATLSLSLVIASCNLALVQAKTAEQTTQKPAEKTVETIYQQAKKELPEHSYVVYRIVERIARANALDKHPWRVRFLPEYDINAFATDVNFIGVYRGLLDQLSGDTSAMACVVGHEMAHNVERHIALSKAQINAMTEQFQQEAEDEVKAELAKVRGRVKIQSILGAFIGVNTSVFSPRSIENGQEKVQSIVNKKKEALQSSILAQSRKNELEADKFGYYYATRAGFEAQGCLRAMEVLARTQNVKLDTTYPDIPARIKALQELIRQHPPETLAAEGKAKISSTKPLTYNLSEDGKLLRVNSQLGSSNNDFERLFNQ